MKFDHSKSYIRPGYPWEAPKILNKDYKEWEQKKIANPKYEADAQLYAYEDFGFAGFDLWQVSGSCFSGWWLCFCSSGHVT
jgi:hypothetical protein